MSHEHSPLPWSGEMRRNGGEVTLLDADGSWVGNTTGVDRRENADFIVHACNSHDDLFRQATRGAKTASRMHRALVSIIELAQEIRDENSGDKCAMDASDIETMARDALKVSGK